MGLFHIVPNAVRGMVTSVRATFKRATPETRAQRMATCRSCPKFTTFMGERCGVCHCPIVRVTFERAHCPDNPPRW